MAGKHEGAGTAATLGPNYYPGSRTDRAYAEGRGAGRSGATTGTDDTSVGAAFLTDSTQSWTTNEFQGNVITNTTNGAYANILSNTATTIIGTLSGSNTWDSGDGYSISGVAHATNPHVSGTDEEAAWDEGLNNHGADDSSTATSHRYETPG